MWTIAIFELAYNIFITDHEANKGFYIRYNSSFINNTYILSSGLKRKTKITGNPKDTENTLIDMSDWDILQSYFL